MTSTTAPAPGAHPVMTISSDLLGSLSVPSSEIFQLQGVLGFPDCRSFVLLPAEREGLYWLQSAEHPELTFLLVDPFRFFDGYSVDLAPSELGELQVSDSSDVMLLAIVTLPKTRADMPTANLQGPLAMNLRARIGRQLVLAEGDWGVRAPFQLQPTDS